MDPLFFVFSDRSSQCLDDIALLHLHNVVTEVVRIQVARAAVAVHRDGDLQLDVSL